MYPICSYSFRKVSEVLRQAEEPLAEYFGGSREAIMDHTSRISDSQTLQTLVVGHYWSKVKHNNNNKKTVALLMFRENDSIWLYC